jgi:hypothetical protein
VPVEGVYRRPVEGDHGDECLGVDLESHTIGEEFLLQHFGTPNFRLDWSAVLNRRTKS